MASNKRRRTQSLSSTASIDVETASKMAHLSSRSIQQHVIACSLPHVETGTLSFPSYLAYEEHYASCHTNRCLSQGCYRNFPSPHYLSLHITENHDPIAEARKTRGDKIYACFLEDCDRLCRDWKKRRAHLVDKHGFPRDYDFLIVKDGIDGRTSMLRSVSGGFDDGRYMAEDGDWYASTVSNRADNTAETKDGIVGQVGAEIDTSQPDSNNAPQAGRLNSTRALRQVNEMKYTSSGSRIATNTSSLARGMPEIDRLTHSLSALKFIPPSVKFGRGGARGGLARH